MAPAATIVQLQAYLRHGSQQRCHTVPVPPFTIFLHLGRNASEDDHAVPDEPLLGDNIREPLTRERESFEARSQRTRS